MSNGIVLPRHRRLMDKVASTPAIPADIQKAAEIAVFAFEARIQGGEFEGLDPDGTEARDALKAEIVKALMAERECAAATADRLAQVARSRGGAHRSDAANTLTETVADAIVEVAAAIRSPQPSPSTGA